MPGAKTISRTPEYKHEYYEKIKHRQKRDYFADPDKVAKKREYDRQWRLANKEKQREYDKTRGIRWPEERAAKKAKRRAAQKARVPAWFGEFDQFVYEEAAALISLREAATGIKWHVDHMVPLQAKEACGLHVGHNFQVIPATLNCWKSAKMVYTETGDWLRHVA
jgi:hypothetical protein